MLQLKELFGCPKKKTNILISSKKETAVKKTMPTRKEKAIQLAEREAFEEKKSRLIQALTQKLLVSIMFDWFKFISGGSSLLTAISRSAKVRTQHGERLE